MLFALLCRTVHVFVLYENFCVFVFVVFVFVVFFYKKSHMKEWKSRPGLGVGTKARGGNAY